MIPRACGLRPGKPRGFDFITGQGVSAANVSAANPTGGTFFNNKVNADMYYLGTAFSW